ncbi:MAG: tRNA (N(6)-L-threonylcarbamoyladenosine(37)-C(2))-methylthiotransferase [Candidatus Thermoplasmatota archaeon]|nr:tRNA (N(6)-L-threonylcarbamoyladenosine(37)-C(2))-methylthiotransferase [Candidatus Thermoplasmatota archaeon]
MKVHFEAFGCTLNKGESHRMAEKACKEGFGLAETPDKSDCIVISTCTVIETTERKMLKRISELAGLRKPMIVSGCMAEIQRDKVLSVAPQAILLPIDGIERIDEVLARLGMRGSDSPLPPSPPLRNVDIAIPIAQGCLGGCTYCITRLARGELRSRFVEDVREDVRRAVDQGYKEVRVCAQDTAAFGIDGGTSLPELVGSLAQLPGDFRIRVGMMNPSTLVRIRDDLLDVFAHERVFKFLHLPVQSGSDRILSLMGRGYTSRVFEELVGEFRRALPDMALSTDIIVGFPGEAERDFQMSYDLIREIEPDLLNITRFSAREGTSASELDGRVEGWEVKRRSRILTKLRSEIGKRKNERIVGSTQHVLLTETVKKGSTVGRTMNYKPVVFREELPLGTFVEARITGAEDAYLWGELL